MKPDPRPPAHSPGARIHVGEQRVDTVTIYVHDYSTTAHREFAVASARECVDQEGRDSPAWIRVTGLHETGKIGELLENYGIHPLVQDDIVNTNHAPKIEFFDDYLFLMAKQLGVPVEGEPEVLQFSAILTDRVLITFEEMPNPLFDPVLARLREGKGRLRSHGPDYLLWALLDAILDQYLIALERLGTTVADVDEDLTRPDAELGLTRIHELRTETNRLYRLVRPMREVVLSLQHSESGLITPGVMPFLRDLYDHSWRAIESAEHLRESVTAIRDYHAAILSQRMNEIMKVLAAISTIFLPLTFIAGVYGMNFVYQPELQWHHGYLAVWILFIAVGAAMLYYFKKKNWL
jgi:magnesium transporter